MKEERIESDFGENNSKFGCKMGEFEDLPISVKRKLIRLMSRIMERAYRRGVQQALCLSESGKIPDWILKDEGYSYRYEKPLEVSKGLDGFVTTSIERLEIEENILDLGLCFYEEDK